MSEVSPVVDAKSEALPADFVRLATAVASLPEPQRRLLEPLLARVEDSSRRRRRILMLVQDALGQLRLDMKYLMFDLEATRRERDKYKARLQSFEATDDETPLDD